MLESGITLMPLELIIFLRSAKNILYNHTIVHDFKIDKRQLSVGDGRRPTSAIFWWGIFLCASQSCLVS